MFRIKRVYDEPAIDDGVRVLVDRLWPRGISKERAAIDEWLKDIAPSSDLRVWFGHKPERFDEFSVRYQDELANSQAVRQLRELEAKGRKVTLLYAAKDQKINHAAVLLEYLQATQPKQ